MRAAATAVGGLAALTGLIWMGQGSGYFPYPASSFMIDQSQWIWIGLAVCLTGLGIIAVGRRWRRT